MHEPRGCQAVGHPLLGGAVHRNCPNTKGSLIPIEIQQNHCADGCVQTRKGKPVYFASCILPSVCDVLLLCSIPSERWCAMQESEIVPVSNRSDASIGM